MKHYVFYEYSQHMFLWRNVVNCSLIVTKYSPYLFHSKKSDLSDMKSVTVHVIVSSLLV